MSSMNKMASSEDKREFNEKGEFSRQKNAFNTSFGNNPDQAPIEANRYHVIWTTICPWSQRQAIIIKLLGLDKVISLVDAYPIRYDDGWSFKNYPDEKDPILKIKKLPEIYAETDSNYTGRATMPTVVDLKERKVISNDYHNLSYYWEKEFEKYHKDKAPNLLPKELEEDIKSFNVWLFNNVNNGVYKCGFAKNQEAYEESYYSLFQALDELEERLSKQRYLFGNQLTDADVRLYCTLARFDVVYYGVFKTNKKRIVDYPNLWNYSKDLYSIPAFKETTNFTGIKMGYQLGNVGPEKYQKLAKGPDISIWDEPHDRNRFENDSKEVHNG